MNSWQNLDKSRPDSAHYSVMKCVGSEIGALREMFPDAKADDLNFVLFSTSGVHGTYMTIEEAEAKKTDVTFVIVHPRLVSMRYGNVQPQTPDDWRFLKELRRSSWEAVQQIGAAAPTQVETQCDHMFVKMDMLLDTGLVEGKPICMKCGAPSTPPMEPGQKDGA